MQEDNAPCKPAYRQKPRRGSEGIKDGDSAVDHGAVEGILGIPDAAVPDGLAGVGAQGRAGAELQLQGPVVPERDGAGNLDFGVVETVLLVDQVVHAHIVDQEPDCLIFAAA